MYYTEKNQGTTHRDIDDAALQLNTAVLVIGLAQWLGLHVLPFHFGAFWILPSVFDMSSSFSLPSYDILVLYQPV